MKKATLATALVLWMLAAGPAAARGQSVRSLVNDGNDLYDERKFDEAEVRYRKALEKERGLTAGRFNLGNALYKQERYDESLREFEDVASGKENVPLRADALYNRGNSLLKGGKYREAADSYIEALKLRPDDGDAKYNLSYALTRLRQQEQKPQDQQQQQQKQQQDQQREQQQEQQQQQQQQQQQNSRPEKRMSKQDAERILEVLRNSEKDVQKKLRVRQGERVKTEKDW